MCGNFGLLLLTPALERKAILRLLRHMLKLTMVRGAQSAGLVTYDDNDKGHRSRVVNRKRSDLSELLLDYFQLGVEAPEVLRVVGPAELIVTRPNMIA